MFYVNKRKYYCFYFLLIHYFQKVLNKKPHAQEQQAVWRLECALGVISEPDCPVDGGWSPWSSWSTCHGTCDDVGYRKRTRECNNPPTSKEGIPCSGSDEQIESCYLTHCVVDDFRKCLNGDSIRTDAMRQLETVPSIMERCLQVECTFYDIENALAEDNTWQLNPEIIWNALQCVKHNVGCPVAGEWGPWGAWSACGSLCGKGFHWRIRKCDTPPPSDDRLICLGNPLQFEDCEGDQCAIDESYTGENTGGNWSKWGEWSPCSENCGIGVRRRRRVCIEKQKPHISAKWGTHCRGQHAQMEVCKNKECLLDGGWSGWGIWGPCSQTCGAGRRFRTRSCTRPMPSGGSNCVGPKYEEGPCHQMPCDVFSHVVALFNGDSFLQYDFLQKRSTLFHSFIRFMPLSPHGSLIRRGDISHPLVRLSLQKWYLCLDARGLSQSCSPLRICSTFVLEPAAWHSAMITVNKESISLRINDAQIPIHGMFPCDPELTDDMTFITVGEKFHGVVQELIVNFIPLVMMINRNRLARTDFVPTSASNIAYEKANIEEAFLYLENDQYLRLPCFDDQNEWNLQLTLKPKKEVGIILFLPGIQEDDWLCIALTNSRLKIKLSLRGFRSETTSSTECLPDQWLDIMLSKQSESGTIETIINASERLHVLLTFSTTNKRHSVYPFFSIRPNQNESNLKQNISLANVVNNTTYVLCYDEFFIGNIPLEYKNVNSEELTSYSGIIASLKVNNNFIDLHSFGVERIKDNKIQLSSRTSSISGFYYETSWGISNSLNLTCLHARTKRTPNKAWWFYLDNAINSILEKKSAKAVDDGKVLRLIAKAPNYHRGFYTCRAHTMKRTCNIVTYGVIGELQYKLAEPDATTIIAIFTTILLVLGTLGWLVIEGINDLRNGYGFFRDAHLSPEEEAAAVCNYIDQNLHLYGSRSAADIAKARARRKGKYLGGRSSYAAQEPQGRIQIEKNLSKGGDYPLSEPEELPALPEVKSFVANAVHNVYRCEPSYIASPNLASNNTAQSQPLSSSLQSSPRDLFPHLLVCKSQSPGIEKDETRKRCLLLNEVIDDKINTSSPETSPCKSPAHKILNKFYMLKHSDD
ncbi:PREDICTED: uncharacterized protein LOC106110609 [Papilio polytes]|uniref:uncharacterized protein LOC106110609 n=1 Tax=Papilio polytes TaxID=76194 RepID=UPI000675DAF8|nr:PREDICTED: uncharacterized protein LOC106110609 [Papilio polytes]